MIWKLVDQFGLTYYLDDPEIIQTGMFGPCLRAPYYPASGPKTWHESGDFRMDKAQSIEPHQERLAEAA